MKKLAIIGVMLFCSTSMVNAETIGEHVKTCIDIEYYSDIYYMNQENLQVMGYIEGIEGPYDRQGNVDITDVVKEKNKIYLASFNVHENKVCINYATDKIFNMKSYEDFNPWVGSE